RRRRPWQGSDCAYSDPGDFAFLEGLDEVAGLAVLEAAEADTALEAFADFAHVVLETLERLDAALPDDGAVAQEANLRSTCDLAAAHETTSDGADARNPEDLADLGFAGDHFFELGRQ